APAVIEQASAWGVRQTCGAGILAALAWLGWRARHVAPVATFGLLWMGAALFPVSNLVAPTGIVLAERTLFLPSVGFLPPAGALWACFAGPPRPALTLARAALVVLLAAGAVRSAVRMDDWQSHPELWRRTLEQAPLSHKAYHAYGQLLWDAGFQEDALRFFHRALALHPPAYWIAHELGDLYRARGECPAALLMYAESLR